MTLTKNQKMLDEFYIAQIGYWLNIVDNAEHEIRFWEAKRKELRSKHVNT